MERRRSPRIVFGSRAIVVFGVPLLLCLLLTSGQAQTITKFERDVAHKMLDQIKEDLKNEYYDPTFHGIDIEARFKIASGTLDKATSVGQVMGIIAQTLMGLNDSHTFFLPPMQTAHVDYGWEMLMIGEKGYVVTVDPGRDAEKAGLKVGDQVLSLDGVEPTRDTLWKIEYLYNALRPQLGMRLLVQSPNELPRIIDARAQVWKDTGTRTGWGSFYRINPDYEKDRKQERELRKDRVIEVDADLVIWKMPSFTLPVDRVNDALKKIGDHKSLILDLRGNRGGYVDTLRLLIGHLFHHDVKIGDRKMRKQGKPELAKSRGTSAFKGDLIVLVDSESASAAEIFARVVQLEKRGTVIGDRTAGAVMESIPYFHRMDTGIPGNIARVNYGVSITIADLIMSDGTSLEKLGVMPDQVIQPTASDLVAKRDVVLSRAAALLNVALDSEKAAMLLLAEPKNQ